MGMDRKTAMHALRARGICIYKPRAFGEQQAPPGCDVIALTDRFPGGARSLTRRATNDAGPWR
eukprot:8187006-Lingulodinium_polyedra.AAC.1